MDGKGRRSAVSFCFFFVSVFSSNWISLWRRDRFTSGVHPWTLSEGSRVNTSFNGKKKPHRNGVFSARVWLLGDNGIMERHKTSCNLCIPIFITSHQKEIQKNPPKHPPQMFLLGNLKFTRILESSWLKFQSNRLQPKMLYISNVWRFGNYNGPNSARKQQKHLDEEWNQANVHVQKSPRTIRK